MTSTLTVLLTAVLRSLRGSTLKIFSNTSAGNVLLMHQSVIVASHFSHTLSLRSFSILKN